MTSGALTGIRVLDLTRILAGPFCTMLLGDLGADVIKVERPGRGDDTRAWGPPFIEDESAYYLGVNRNKRSITLDLGDAEGLAVLHRLVPKCDVVIDNFKTGTMGRFGLDDAWYEEHAPHVVRCSILGYGSTGPLAERPGYDFILQAESGLMAITGEPDGEPMKLGVAVVDLTTGLLATIATLAALHERSRSGRGQYTEVSLHDTGLTLLANVASNVLASGAEAVRYGNGHPNIVPYRSFRTADGEIALAVGNDDQFGKLSELVGHPEWAHDPRLATNRERVENRPLVDGLVQDALLTRSRDEWIAALDEAGIPAGRVNSVQEALAAPHALARELVTSIEHPALGALRTLGLPIRLGETPASIRRHPPLLGEHTDEVLAELLDSD